MNSVDSKNREFQRISKIFAPLAAGYPGAFNLTDDAAVISPATGNELVVTTDTMIARVHFMPNDDPKLIGRRLLRVNLSDLAAMGARPLGYMLNIALPNKIKNEWLEAFASGLAVDQEKFSISLIGSNAPLTVVPAVKPTKSGILLLLSTLLIAFSNEEGIIEPFKSVFIFITLSNPIPKIMAALSYE